MNEALVRAIREKRRLACVYNGKPRLAEPQCYGEGAPGELLRVYQPAGGSEREPLFTVAKMARLAVLDERYERPGPNYRKNDSAMKRIFAQPD